MINVGIPELSEFFSVDIVLRFVEKDKGGVYFLFSESEEMLYIGKSVSLFKRIGEHIKGLSPNTSHFYREIAYVKFFYVEDRTNQDIYETYLINNWKPKHNIGKTFFRETSSKTATKIYQLRYDDEIDHDIHNWLEKLPSNRKAEMVRNAIRFYLHATNGNAVPIIPIEPATAMKAQEPPKETKPRKRAKKIIMDDE